MNIARGTQQTYTQRGFHLATQSQLDSIHPLFFFPGSHTDGWSPSHSFPFLMANLIVAIAVWKTRRGRRQRTAVGELYTIRGTGQIMPSNQLLFLWVSHWSQKSPQKPHLQYLCYILHTCQADVTLLLGFCMTKKSQN